MSGALASVFRYGAVGVLLLTMLVLGFAEPSRAGDDLLNELSVRSAQLHAASGSFRQKRSIQQLPVALNSSGTFRYSSSEGINWRTLKPVESALSISEQGLVIDGRDQPLDSTLFARLILKIFLGDVSALKEYFLIDAAGNSESWIIQLSPATEAVALQYESIQITGAEFTESLLLKEASGDSTQIDFYDVSISPVANGIRD